MKVLGCIDQHPAFHGIVPTEPEFHQKCCSDAPWPEREFFVLLALRHVHEMNTSFELEEATKIGFVAFL